MNRHRSASMPLILVSLYLWLGMAQAETSINPDPDQASQILIHVDQGKDRIAPEIYGHFAEHLGRCVYEGFWVGPQQ